MNPNPGGAAPAPTPARSGVRQTSTRVHLSRRPPGGSRQRGWVVASVVAVLVLGLAFSVRGAVQGGDAGPAGLPISPALEEQWGVRFTQLAMSADGGMVDVRYVVLDVDKASLLAASPETTPILVEESSGRALFTVAIKAHGHDLHSGGRYYLLYRNAGGLIAPGQRVTIGLGHQRVEHVPVAGARVP